MDQRIADRIADRLSDDSTALCLRAPTHSPYMRPLSYTTHMTALLQDLLPYTGLPIGAPIAIPPLYTALYEPLSQAPLMDAPRAIVHRQTRPYTNQPPLEGPRRSPQSRVGHSPALSSPIRDWGVGLDRPAMSLEQGYILESVDLDQRSDPSPMSLDELLLRVLESCSFKQSESRLRLGDHVLMLSALDDGPKVPEPINDSIIDS